MPVATLSRKVTILDLHIRAWSGEEVKALLQAGIEVETSKDMKARLVAKDDHSEESLRRILVGKEFTVDKVHQHDRWR